VGAKPRFFISVLQHTAARFIMADLAAAFAAAGYPTLFIDFCPLLQNSLDQAEQLRNRLREIEEFAPDIAVAYGMEAFVPLPGYGDLFSFNKLPQINLFFDFHDWNMEVLARHPLIEEMTGPDCLYFCWDNEAIVRMINDGFCRVHYLPLAVNPEVFTDTTPPGVTRPAPVSFIGLATPERVRWLEPLVAEGLRVHGPGSEQWEKNEKIRAVYHGAQNDRREVNRYYNDSYMSINITQTHGSDSLNMRIFEALATGCLLLTDDKPVLGQTFALGDELVVHHGDDLLQLVRYYREHPEKGNEIARCGQIAVREAHTYHHRVKEIMGYLPDFLDQRSQYQRALQEISRNELVDAYRILKKLERATPPFSNRDHLHYYLWFCGRQVVGEEAQLYLRRLAVQHPQSFFLKKISS